MTHVGSDDPIRRFSSACLGLALVFFVANASAGVVIESNIVYANLSGAQDQLVDSALKRAINSEKPECWVKGAGLIYINKRPPGITNELISRALLQENLSAKRRLSKALLSYQDEEVRGFDGVVVYVDKPVQRFLSITAKTLVINSRR